MTEELAGYEPQAEFTPLPAFLGDSQAKNGFRIFKELGGGRGEAAIESACGLQSLYLLFGPL